MPRDRCTTRLHCLGTPPSVRGERRPGDGAMACLLRAQGECPFRSRYGCDEEVRAWGLERGRCVIELAYREEVVGPLLEALPHVDETDRATVADLIERAGDAAVYLRRAQHWLALAWERRPVPAPDGFWGVELERAQFRYARAGACRVARLLRRLRPYMDRAAWRLRLARLLAQPRESTAGARTERVAEAG